MLILGAKVHIAMQILLFKIINYSASTFEGKRTRYRKCCSKKSKVLSTHTKNMLQNIVYDSINSIIWYAL